MEHEIVGAAWVISGGAVMVAGVLTGQKKYVVCGFLMALIIGMAVANLH